MRQQEAAWEGGVRHEWEEEGREAEEEAARRAQLSPWQLLAAGMERLREQVPARPSRSPI